MNYSTPAARFKRGDTFIFSGTITVTDGGTALSSLAGFTGRSELRELSGVLIADLGFEWINAATRQCRLRAQNTAAWPVGPAKFDIQLTSAAGEVMSTETAFIDIVEDVTK